MATVTDITRSGALDLAPPDIPSPIQRSTHSRDVPASGHKPCSEHSLGDLDARSGDFRPDAADHVAGMPGPFMRDTTTPDESGIA